MSNVTTVYADFTVLDYQSDSTTLSSYNLSLTPLYFSPIIPTELGTSSRVVWDFGDGTSSDITSTSHVYERPGIYTVKLFVYDCFNQANLATVTKSIVVKDYITDTFKVTTVGRLTAYTGALTNELVVTQTIPFYVQDSTITYSVSGSRSNNYFQLVPFKYNHLERYNSIIQKSPIASTNTTELVEIDNLNVKLSAIYATISNGSIQTSVSSTPSSIVVGYSGYDVFYYRDDTVTPAFNLTFNRVNDSYSNTLGITLSGSIIDNTDLDHLSITSNGLDGDSLPLSTFDITGIKFVNTPIHFVVKLKDNLNNSLKNTSALSLSSLTVKLLQGTTLVPTSSYSVSSLQGTLTSLDCGGYFRGYVTYTDLLEQPLTSITLNVSSSDIITTSLVNIGSASGSSSVFDIYPANYYQLYKKGEDFDGEATFKSLRFQETLLDKEVLFTDFFGTIFGNAESDSECLGKKINERITNFIDNTTNIDTAEIIRLMSMSEMLDNTSTIFDQNLVNFPNKIQRVIGLQSIQDSKLFGITNKYQTNFNPYGRTTTEVYAKNLGEQIDPYTFVVSPDIGVVAYEKFSRTYKLLNTYQPLCGTITNPVSNPILAEDDTEIDTESGDELFVEDPGYLIIDYTNSWGWPLLLPTGFQQDDIPLYYDFYLYEPGYAGDYVGGVLDMDMSFVSNNNTDTFNYIMLDTLTQSLSLSTD